MTDHLCLPGLPCARCRAWRQPGDSPEGMDDIIARPIFHVPGLYLKDGRPAKDARWPGRGVAHELGARAWTHLQNENRRLPVLEEALS